MRAKEHNYAFIDSQNLNLGIKDLGWSLDFRKFRIYLENKYRVDKAFLFLGFIPRYHRLYEELSSYEYILVFKPVIQNRDGKIKGNIDAELVMYTMKELQHFDKAVIVSGDGDFYCLIEYLEEFDKLKAILIPNQKSSSSLLENFSDKKVLLEFEEAKLRKQKRKA